MASAPSSIPGPNGPDTRKNARVALMALAGALAMLGLGYASVPLYDLFCRVTGFGGTTQRASETDAERAERLSQAADLRDISIRFDGNTDPDMPWVFGPEDVTQTIRIGQRDMAFYTAKNLSDEPITGTASFNVAPDYAGPYFNKIQCFCFVEQTLQPGEEVRMPVLFYVDPAMLEDEDAKKLSQITLSYTFHRSKEQKAANAS